VSAITSPARPGTPHTLTGWGRVAPSRAWVTGPLERDRLAELVASAPPGGILARGAGCSYGDAAQNEGGVVLHPVTAPGIEIDAAGPSLRASAATTFTELLARTVPLGLLPPVLPGTRHLTVGGAVAADVHGKNQHADGSISGWIDEIELLAGDGSTRTILPGTPAFRATVGGMGLTGIILSVRLRLLRIRSGQLRVTTRRYPDLDALLAAQDAAAQDAAAQDPATQDAGARPDTEARTKAGARYAVAWVDMSAAGRSLGRGVLDTADHLPEPGPGRLAGPGDADVGSEGLRYDPGRPRRAPALPACPFTPLSARAFNRLWYRAAPAARTDVVGIPAYFHRLDAVRDWNRALGRRGFLQYQFVIPVGSEKIIAHVIETVQDHRAAAFLGTLKRFGPAGDGYLSFPLPGWSLAVDMPAGRPGLRAMLAELDRRVADAGGRVYLAKDARLSRAAFTRMYPGLEDWRAARAELDPRAVFRSDLGRRLGLVDP
jgi:decaprenylphospho-beta-D-ribofuranose 2-oxidase